jgi:glycosyltransferase involved in cell wall biosynthesis
MRISHYFEWGEYITGGHAQSVSNQRRILQDRGIDYTTEPELEADVLHLNNMGPRSVYYARMAHRNGTPVLIHTHQTAEDLKDSFTFADTLSAVVRPYLEYAYSLADRLVCPSEHNKRVIQTYTSVPKTVISNGFDSERLAGFEQLRNEYLERYDLTPPVVFNVGHVIERKGLRSFIDTAERMPETDFVWFGYINPTGGRLGELLKDRSVERLLSSSPDNCTFTGYIDDIRGAYAAGDVFLFPSRNENEGMALLEAMSCGKPPVVRDIDVFDWLDHRTDCVKSDGGFVAAVQELLDESERRRIGSNASERTAEFTLDSVGDELVAVYRSLLE